MPNYIVALCTAGTVSVAIQFSIFFVPCSSSHSWLSSSNKSVCLVRIALNHRRLHNAWLDIIVHLPFMQTVRLMLDTNVSDAEALEQLVRENEIYCRCVWWKPRILSVLVAVVAHTPSIHWARTIAYNHALTIYAIFRTITQSQCWTAWRVFQDTQVSNSKFECQFYLSILICWRTQFRLHCYKRWRHNEQTQYIYVRSTLYF